MTSYYKGNTIGLNYDAANATWSFTNEPNDFIDPASFSTADPAFEYAPPPSTDDDQDDDFNPCPPGYIYDSSLKQCVIDPSQQTTEYQKTTGDGQDITPVQIAGTNRFTADNNFMATDEEYKNMSAVELIENYKQRGYIDKDETGNLVIDLNKADFGATIMDNLLGRYGGGGEASARKKKLFTLLWDKGIVQSEEVTKLNPELFNFYPSGGQAITIDTFPITRLSGEIGKITLPTIASFEADYYGIKQPNITVQGWGDKIFGFKKSVQKFDSYMQEKLDKFKTVSMNTISTMRKEAIPDIQDKTQQRDIIKNRIEEEKARKAKIEADSAQIELDRKKVEDRKGEEKAKRDMQETIRKAEKKQKVKEEYRDKGQVTYKPKETGGYVTTPNIPSAPPRERGGGGYTKPTSYERKGTSGIPGYHW